MHLHSPASPLLIQFHPDRMKKPTPELKQRMCTRKRRYRTQGDALDAALLAGVERQRQAYRCTCLLCTSDAANE